VETKERHGVVSEEILQEQREGDHDLIVIGRHLDGTTRFGAVDLTSEILQRAECPVLVVTGELGRFR
jgi:nucleotide-binding universal stress UspA family protein